MHVKLVVVLEKPWQEELPSAVDIGGVVRTATRYASMVAYNKPYTGPKKLIGRALWT